MTRQWRFGGEALFALCLAALGVVAMAASWRAGFGKMSEPDAGLFPFFSGLAVLLGGALATARAVAFPDAGESVEESSGLKLAALIATMAGWILILPVAGFVLATFIAVLLLARILGLEGWLKPLGLAAAGGLTVHVLFQRMLFIDLPTGIFG